MHRYSNRCSLGQIRHLDSWTSPLCLVTLHRNHRWHKLKTIMLKICTQGFNLLFRMSSAHGNTLWCRSQSSSKTHFGTCELGQFDVGIRESVNKNCMMGLLTNHFCNSEVEMQAKGSAGPNLAWCTFQTLCFQDLWHAVYWPARLCFFKLLLFRGKPPGEEDTSSNHCISWLWI